MEPLDDMHEFENDAKKSIPHKRRKKKSIFRRRIY